MVVVVHVPHMLGHMTAMFCATTFENAVDGSHCVASTCAHTCASVPLLQRAWADAGAVVADTGTVVVPFVDLYVVVVEMIEGGDGVVAAVHLLHMFGHMDAIRWAKGLEKAVDGLQWFASNSMQTSASTPLAHRA